MCQPDPTPPTIPPRKHGHTPARVLAWHEIFKLSSVDWQPIPRNLAAAAGILDSRIGIAGGVFQTRQAAEGAQEFTRRLNRKLDKTSRKLGIS